MPYVTCLPHKRKACRLVNTAAWPLSTYETCGPLPVYSVGLYRVYVVHIEQRATQKTTYVTTKLSKATTC